MEVVAAYGLGNAVVTTDLATATVAALAPKDWRVEICDDRLTPADLDHDADVIGITGKVSQHERMVELADHFRSRGKLVVIGGPYASLDPDAVRDHCDILVRNEIEEIAAVLFAEIDAGTWKREYDGGKVDLSNSPVPRWDLYPRRGAMSGVVQTSRGCPFECEFCDVIAYVGRKQRHKPVGLVIGEIDNLYSLGYRAIFLADDNFTVYRRRAKELLTALRDWNRAHAPDRVLFSTQVSIDIARDDEMLELCAEAGLRNVFIGIETPNEESLRIAKKRQNIGVDIGNEVEKVLRKGIAVSAGIIVGFDGDGPDIFDIQAQFIEKLPVPFVTVSALVAPPQTPLYARLVKEGRIAKSDILKGADATPTVTNIIPKNMSYDELIAGLSRLCREVYAPATFERRMIRFMDAYGSRIKNPPPGPTPVPIGKGLGVLMERFSRIGPAEKNLFTRLLRQMSMYPRDIQMAARLQLTRYMQLRHMYDLSGLWPIEKPIPAVRSAKPIHQVN